MPDDGRARVERVLAPNPGYMTGTGTNTYLVDGGDGAVAVIDPGPAEAAHLDAIEAAVGSQRRIVAILVTHGHSDHLPGAPVLRQRTGAPLYGHRLLPARLTHPLEDGERVEVGGVALEALATPGHTDDSLCYWDAEAHALFTGDLVAGAGTVIVDDAPGGLARYLASLERLRGLGACAIYPGHGPRVEDGAGKLAEYLAHRRQREAQVVAALRQGARSVDDLVHTIYPDVAPALVPMAARNVRAHLWLLRDTGRAAEQGGRWRLTDG